MDKETILRHLCDQKVRVLRDEKISTMKRDAAIYKRGSDVDSIQHYQWVCEILAEEFGDYELLHDMTSNSDTDKLMEELLGEKTPTYI